VNTALMAEDDLRVGDADRDRVARQLRDHCADGRIAIEELDARLEVVYQATTRRELAQTTSDLPHADEGRRSARPNQRFFWPGIAAFHEERHLTDPCAASYAAALREMVPRLGMQGYHVVEDISPRRLRFVSGSGLFITVMFHPAADGGTDVSAFGHAPRSVRKAFATLRD
jgi:hypothetical protein